MCDRVKETSLSRPVVVTGRRVRRGRTKGRGRPGAVLRGITGLLTTQIWCYMNMQELVAGFFLQLQLLKMYVWVGGGGFIHPGDTASDLE